MPGLEFLGQASPAYRGRAAEIHGLGVVLYPTLTCDVLPLPSLWQNAVVLPQLTERKEWKFFAVLWTADPDLAAAWWTALLVRGILPAAFAIASPARLKITPEKSARWRNRFHMHGLTPSLT